MIYNLAVVFDGFGMNDQLYAIFLNEGTSLKYYTSFWSAIPI